MNYEDFFTEQEVQTYKHVKRGTMRLAAVAREVAAFLVDGSIGCSHGSKKEFLQSKAGEFRMAMNRWSDNTTERAAHDRMGVQTVHMNSDKQMREFFKRHGYLHDDVALQEWKLRIKELL